MTWFEYANCLGVDPDLFFADKSGRAASETRAAKQVCAGCTVRTDCLHHAVDNHENYGIWGGTTPRERRTLRRHRDEVVG